MKKLCLMLAVVLASVTANAQTKAIVSNVFMYDMGEMYYNSANFDQQNKIESGWFAKYGKIASKYMKLSQYTSTLSGFTMSYKGKDAGVMIVNLAKVEEGETIKQYLGVFNGQAKFFIDISAKSLKNSKYAVKVKYTDIAANKTETKDFTEEYFIADNYLVTLLNEKGDAWFTYATQPATGLKFDKVSDYDMSKTLFAQILGSTPVGDIFRWEYNGAYGYTAKVFNDDKYDYIVAGADKKVFVKTGYLGDNLKSISFTTTTDGKKQTIKLPETTYSYMGFIMDFLAKNGYLK